MIDDLQLEAPPERVPFWSYTDLILFIGLGVPGMVGTSLVLQWALTHVTKLKALQVLPAELVGYGVLFGLLAAILRVQYGRSFWDSLGWKPMRAPAGLIMGAGLALSIGLAALGKLLRLPEGPNPMKDLIADPVSLLLVGAFASTVGPLFEELAFRGFLQPLLVRSLGAGAGIVVTAIPFGLLHLPEYGYSWRYALLVSAAGAGFGCMRHWTGSTRASALMHAAYNGLIFLALIASRRDLPHSW
jgi:membrane protease YdiL (CAAX protease family)